MVIAGSRGDVTITNAGEIDVEASVFNAYGVYARNQVGDVSIENKADAKIIVRAEEDAYGLAISGEDYYDSDAEMVIAGSRGDVTITNAGKIDVTATLGDAYGVFVYQQEGNVDIENKGSGSDIIVRAQGDAYGVLVRDGSKGDVFISNLGSVDVASTGTLDDLESSSFNAYGVAVFQQDGNVTIINETSGLIAASSGEDSAHIYGVYVDSSSSPAVSLINRGEINGDILLQGGGNKGDLVSFENAAGGVWRPTANSQALLMVGEDVSVKNQGTIEIAGDTGFVGMNTFDNSGGKIDMTKDDGEFSALTLDFSGSEFIGGSDGSTHSTILIDATLGLNEANDVANKADGNGLVTDSDTIVMQASGEVKVSDVTKVAINDLEPSKAGVNSPVGSVVITVEDSEVPLGSFILENGPINKGLWQYDLYGAFDGEDTTWSLASAPSAHAFELPVLLTSAQESWHKSASLIGERFSELRAKNDSVSAPKTGLWARVLGASTERDLSNSYRQPTYGASPNGVAKFATDYSQDISGVVVGIDKAILLSGDSSWLLGGALGITRSKTDFDLTSTKLDRDAGTVSLYAAYQSAGGGFLNFLVKYDAGDTEYKMSNRSVNPSGDISYTNTGLSTKVFGGALEAGYRFQGAKAFFEPSIRIATAKAKIDRVSMLETDVEFSGGKSTRSSLTLATGYASATQGSRTEPFAYFSVINESAADNEVRLTSGGQAPVVVKDGEVGTVGQLGVGIRFYGTENGSQGFLKADYTGNSDTKGYSLSGGVKFVW